MPGEAIQVADALRSAPPSRVHRTESEILFDTGTGHQHQYAIELERLDTPEKVLHWVAHVGQKRWATAKMLSDFVGLACPGVYETLP